MSHARRHRPTAEDRERCLEALVAELVAGRLSDEEFDLRWALALEAPTVPALRCLLDDLDDLDDDLDELDDLDEDQVAGEPDAPRQPVSRLRAGLLTSLVRRWSRPYR